VEENTARRDGPQTAGAERDGNTWARPPGVAAGPGGTAGADAAQRPAGAPSRRGVSAGSTRRATTKWVR
jgi:hypothetical protein